MHGFTRAIARLLVMAAVMGAVLVGGLVMGVGTITAVGLGIVLAGIVGLVGVVRRPVPLSASQEIQAILAADPLDGRKPVAAAPNRSTHAPSLVEATRVESMAPVAGGTADPEASMPRWRRPSLLEARHSDPTRRSPTEHVPMRFGDGAADQGDVRVIRYAVVPVLDRPDEVLGRRLTDLGAGDEVRVLGASGAFLQVLCPNGDQGFVHRTTLGRARAAAGRDLGREMPKEADDALTAVLSARGLI